MEARRRRIARGLRRRIWRLRKYLAQVADGWTGYSADETRPVFVFGSQRSGTKMLLRTFDRSMDTWVYPEYNRRAFDSDYRVRSFDRLEELVERCRAPTVVFKPICDSHLGDRFLDRFDGSGARALWIYRDYRDVVNSSVRKWGDHFAEVMRLIAEGRGEEVGWRAERLSEERISEIRRWSREGLSAEDGAAVFWYVRNRFFFDLDLEGDARVSLVRYEDLVRDPESYLPGVFGFVGIRFELEFSDRIHAGSVGRNEEPALAPPVRSACEALRSKLDRAHQGSSRDRRGAGTRRERGGGGQDGAA